MQTLKGPTIDNLRLAEEKANLEERLLQTMSDFDALKIYAEHCTSEIERLTLKVRRLDE